METKIDIAQIGTEIIQTIISLPYDAQNEVINTIRVNLLAYREKEIKQKLEAAESLARTISELKKSTEELLKSAMA